MNVRTACTRMPDSLCFFDIGNWKLTTGQFYMGLFKEFSKI